MHVNMVSQNAYDLTFLVGSQSALSIDLLFDQTAKNECIFTVYLMLNSFYNLPTRQIIKCSQPDYTGKKLSPFNSKVRLNM